MGFAFFLASLEALIVIKNNYPQSLPLFSLCMKFNGVHFAENNDEVRVRN